MLVLQILDHLGLLADLFLQLLVVFCSLLLVNLEILLLGQQLALRLLCSELLSLQHPLALGLGIALVL